MAAEPAEITLDDTEDHVARVERVADDISSAADEIDQTRRLPNDLLAKMHSEKLFRLLLPKVYGGLEIDPVTFFRVTSAIAQRDASVGWVTCQGNGCSTSAAYVPPKTAMEVWGNDPAGVLAWGPGKADVDVREDGYQVNEGRWQFASGLRHATYLGGRFTFTKADGTEDTRALLFRKEDCELIDIWNVMGLRGTASDGYSVKDLFVPKGFSLSRHIIPEERHCDGPLYTIPTTNLYAVGFSGVANGIARGMLEDFKALASEKQPYRMKQRLAETTAVQNMVATCEAKLGSSRLYVLNEAAEVFEDVKQKGELTLDSRMRIRLSTTFAIHQAKDVVDEIYDATGATSIFNSSLFQRRFRDIHTLTQQGQGRKTNFNMVGQQLMGLDPDLPTPY
jgi:indole-3-acetate monooxygenase